MAISQSGRRANSGRESWAVGDVVLGPSSWGGFSRGAHTLVAQTRLTFSASKNQNGSKREGKQTDAGEVFLARFVKVPSLGRIFLGQAGNGKEEEKGPTKES